MRIDCLVVPTPFRVGAVNCYLIHAGRLTLVDTGPNTEEAWFALNRELARVGHRLEEIDALLLTHQHFDHIGLASAIAKESKAEVIAHARLASFLADYGQSMDAEDEFARGVMVAHGVDPADASALIAQSQTRRPLGRSVHVDRLVVEGDMVDLGKLELRVGERPGHSPTDTIFIDEAGRRALVGDHLIAHISSNPILHRPFDNEATDPRDPPHRLAEYLSSMRGTAELDLVQALPGHGTAIADVAALVERRLDGHDRRKERISSEIAGGAWTLPDLIETLWPALPLDQLYLATSEVIGHIDLLRTQQRVTRLADEDVIQFRPVEAEELA